jgi:hypothetical protein
MNSLMSHWRRADTGKVRCHKCVPDVLSSPNDRLPARIAIINVLITPTLTTAVWKSLVILAEQQPQQSQACPAHSSQQC